jgi:hypothetical protein
MYVNGRVLLLIGMRFSVDLNDGDKFAIDELGDGSADAWIYRHLPIDLQCIL